ncbi:sigma-70 family RNA polymerase sigma factor [Amycolatopsis anabasis]|uniref:sigma-70 family RNA polymerase sigma factor n=1 Tax=Amycolatopsis anabasis TaxID=1840409 RepID=UPI001FE90C5F|nr:sigma-70 family RNA polymerase sigma factor [Amycolatopsis anabasis]
MPHPSDDGDWHHRDLIDTLWQLRGPLLAHTIKLTKQDRHWAEDVVQETLLRAWQNAHKLNRELDMLRSWLFTVARRIVIDTWRTRKARPHEVELSGTEVSSSSDATDGVLATMLVDEAVRHLSHENRDAVREVYLKGNTVREAADALGVPVGTIKSRLHNARHAMRARLREAG